MCATTEFSCISLHLLEDCCQKWAREGIAIGNGESLKK